MGEIWYEIGGYGKRINPVNVDRSTDSSVWINGKRRARQGTYSPIYPTWDEAKQALLVKAEEKVKRLRYQLERANSDLGNIKGLKP